jgi:hypothetical protein
MTNADLKWIQVAMDKIASCNEQGDCCYFQVPTFALLIKRDGKQ